MAAVLICLLLPLSLGATWGWGSARALGLFAAAAVLGTAWVRIELRSETPLIDMRVMRLPTVWTANLASLLFGGTFPGPDIINRLFVIHILLIPAVIIGGALEHLLQKGFGAPKIAAVSASGLQS